MHSIVTTFREAVIKVEVANFGAAIDTLIDQDDAMCEGHVISHGSDLKTFMQMCTSLSTTGSDSYGDLVFWKGR